MKALRLLIMVVLVWGTAAHAAVIFSNGGIGNNGFISDTDFPPNGQFSADDFILATGANTITGIQWTGSYFPGNTPQAADVFTIQIYADVAGAPAAGAPLLTLPIGNPGRTDTGVNTLAGDDIFAYSVNVAPIVVAAGTRFWLSIFNNTSVDTNDNWFWTIQDGAGNSFTRTDMAGAWSQINNRHDFTLIGTVVPEPSTLALLLIGGIGLLSCRRNARARVFHAYIG